MQLFHIPTEPWPRHSSPAWPFFFAWWAVSKIPQSV
jgi:hypothetical protein